MRADKRSFSFTWMRGGGQAQKNTENNSDSGIENPQADFSQMDTASTSSSWYMTNASTASSSSGVSSMSGSSSVSSMTMGSGTSSCDQSKETLSMTQNDSKSKLRRLGHSFTRFGTKYSIIEDDEEESQPLNAIPTPTAEATPTTKLAEQFKKLEAQPVHFDEDGKFIGRHHGGVAGSASRRKSRRSSSVGKDSGSNVASSSLGRKLNRTVQEMKASIGNFSQKFRRSTRRRYRMGRGTPLAEITPTRKILGRTPTKLYSPFEIGFDSPACKTPKRLERPSTPRLTRRSIASGLVYSPANNFGKDLAEAKRGMEDFQILSRDITRRSVRF